MSILTTLAVNSVIFSILFGLILLVRKFFSKKMSITCQYLLWAIVLLKLLLPFGFEAAILPQAAYTPAPQQQVQQDFERPTSNNTQVAQTVNEEAALSVAEETFDNTPIQPVQPSAAPIHWSTYLLIAWIAGMALMSAFLLWYHRQIHRRLRHNSAVVGSQVLETAKLCMRELGIHRRIHICMQKKVEVPAISGLLRTTLILPASLNEADRETIYNVCLHELLHYKSGDLYLIAFLNIINILYWFHPLVWRAISLIRDDMESMCDKRVLARTQSRDNYVSTILEFATGKSNHRLKAALSMAGGGRVSMEERIRNMFRNKKMKTGSRAAVGLLAIAMLGTSLLTACKPVGAGAASATDLELPQKSASLQQKYEIPERYQDSYTLAGGAQVKIDADVIWPAADSMVTAEMKLQPLTQQQLDKAVEVILGEVSLYERQLNTREDIQAGLKEGYAQLEQLKNLSEEEFNENGGLGLGMTKQEYIEQYEGSLRKAESEISNYPERDSSIPATLQMKPFYNKDNQPQGVSLLVEADKGDGKRMVIDAYAFHDNLNSGLKIGESADSHRIKEYLIETPPTAVPYGVRMDKAEAQKRAGELVAQIDPDLKLTYTGIGFNYNEGTQDTWAMIFKREVDGFSTTYTELDHGNDIEDENGNLVEYQAHPYERMVVHINDGGLQYFEWIDPCSVGPAGPVEGMSFEQMKAAARQGFPKGLSQYTREVEADVEIIVSQVRLGLMRVSQPDGSFRLIPVWDFLGYKKSDISMDGVSAEQQAESDARMEEWYTGWGIHKRRPMLTINALDGSVINRGMGK